MFKNMLLIAILIGATILRVSQLTNNPPTLFADEVDAGYQADSLIHFGTDYFGNSWPTHFHSFADWRTSGYIYSIALVKLFISDPDISVRIPSVIFSLGTIFIFFLLTKSHFAAFLLAVSPWSIHYGRTGFEVSGMIFFLLLGIFFLQRKRFYLSILFFCITPYFYSTAKLFLLILFPIIIILYKKDILSLGFKKILLLFAYSLLLLYPMAVDTLQGRSGFRFSYISIFTMPHREQIVDTLRYQDILQDHPNEIGVKTPFISQLFHNKYQLVFEKFFQNYISSFSTKFLFLTGDDNIRHGFGSHGLLYLIDFFTILIGIYLWAKNKTTLGSLFFLILLIAPVPFALTRDSFSPHATRLIFMLPSLIYFSASTISKFKYLIFVYIFSFVFFSHYYFSHYPQDSAMQWHTGMKDTVMLTKNYSQNIYYSSKYEPFTPFFLYYHPYQQLPSISQITNDSFSGITLDNKYFFGNINPSNTSQIPLGSIVVVPESEYKSGQYDSFKTIQKVEKKYINQEEFRILTL